MIVEIDIAAGMDSLWRERVHRQINFKFASAGPSLKMLTARLYPCDGGLYICEMEARLRNGERRKGQTQGEHPNMCIADTAARLARSIRRDKMFSATGEVAH